VLLRRERGVKIEPLGAQKIPSGVEV